MNLQDKATVSAWAMSFATSSQSTLISTVKEFSMLHHQSLQLIYEFGLRAPGVILEIGTYIGGSSVMIGSAAKSSNKRVISVEVGGSYSTHPQIPSSDILGDLRKNLDRFELSDVVDIVEGHAATSETVARVNELRGCEEIGLIFIDADGHVERDFSLYAPMLAKNAFVVFDDYENPESNVKTNLVHSFVEKGLEQKIFHDLGVYQWGTWAGQYLAGGPSSA